MENLLLIRVNHLSWTAEERDMIIETALDIYLTKKRKTKIDQTKFNLLLGIRQKTKKQKVKEGRTDSGITINLESDDDISSEDETIFNSEVVSFEAEETNSSTDDFSDDTDSEFEGFHPSDID
ncbi:hypothetical protein SNE40_002837 [Patella caerulea]|uniref:Uncharacterized protein n=1 Tax=Patella caerulea TaxID=87958 RepID=A0AAN8QEK9_PATCE